MAARFSAPVQTGPGVHLASFTMGTGSFLGVKSSWGMTLTLHPLLVPWSRKSRAIPLLPLWAIQPVQSLSACTRVHFNFIYTSTPPMGRTACTEPQCLYNGAPLTLPIPLLPLWAIQPVQSLSACTRVHFNFLYTSTPPMSHTACTEPQCLHKGALYLYLYLYSSYGPYSLYRVSVPVQGCTLPLPLLTK